MPVLKDGSVKLDDSDRKDAKSPTIQKIVEAVMEETGGTGDVKTVVRSLGHLFCDVDIKRCVDPDSFQPFILAPVRFDLKVIE